MWEWWGKAEASLHLAAEAAFLPARNALLGRFEEDLIAYQQLEADALARARVILNFAGNGALAIPQLVVGLN